MATSNMQAFVATNNTLVADKREKFIPAYIHAKRLGESVPVTLEEWLNNIEDYVFSMVKFGFARGRKEDGMGERAYHLTDLETFLNTVRTLGLAKSYPEFMQHFKPEDGWYHPKLVMKEVPEQTGEKEVFIRETYLNDENFVDIYNDIKEGKCFGLDVVDYNGKIHHKCKLLRISDLHPSVKKTIWVDVTDELTGEVSKEQREIVEEGVDSDLWLILTNDALTNGYNKIEGEDELSLKGSLLLRTPLGFVAMRRSRTEEIPGPWPNGTGLLQSMCPTNFSYSDFDKTLALATMVITKSEIPGVIAKSISHLNQQAFLSEDLHKAYMDMLEYILSPREEKDGLAKVYKNWLLLTGQHVHYETIIETANSVYNARPKPLNNKGDMIGRNLTHILGTVLDIEFKPHHAVLPEFQAVLNPRGVDSGESAIKTSNPNPYYIKVLNMETNEWEDKPCTGYILFDSRGSKYFVEGDDVMSILSGMTFETPTWKPLTGIYDSIERTLKEQKESLNK